MTAFFTFHRPRSSWASVPYDRFLHFSQTKVILSCRALWPLSSLFTDQGHPELPRPMTAFFTFHRPRSSWVAAPYDRFLHFSQTKVILSCRAFWSVSSLFTDQGHPELPRPMTAFFTFHRPRSSWAAALSDQFLHFSQTKVILICRALWPLSSLFTDQDHPELPRFLISFFTLHRPRPSWAATLSDQFLHLSQIKIMLTCCALWSVFFTFQRPRSFSDPRLYFSETQVILWSASLLFTDPDHSLIRVFTFHRPRSFLAAAPFEQFLRFSQTQVILNRSTLWTVSPLFTHPGHHLFSFFTVLFTDSGHSELPRPLINGKTSSWAVEPSDQRLHFSQKQDILSYWTLWSASSFSTEAGYPELLIPVISVFTFHRIRSSWATDRALFSSEKMLISFLFLNENICCGYSLEAPQRGASNAYHNICFRGEIWKILYGYLLLSVAMPGLLVPVISVFTFHSSRTSWAEAPSDQRLHFFTHSGHPKVPRALTSVFTFYRSRSSWAVAPFLQRLNLCHAEPSYILPLQTL